MELNTRYFLKDGEYIQGKPSFWGNSGVYFIYWQQQMRRWAICDLKCYDAVKDGPCPGWAYRSDASHFANACGWVERRASEWTGALIETAVGGVCAKGLKVEVNGFAQEHLNTTYVENPDEEVQGRLTFWDPTGEYFIYWQDSMMRWAMCDKVSLRQAKSGLAPGWAYRTDSAHFSRPCPNGWLEVSGRDWERNKRVRCRVLEGNVQEDHAMVKAEQGENEGGTTDNGGDAAVVPAEQYPDLIKQLYEQVNPTKLKELPKLLAKFSGREHELYMKACERYEVDADDFIAKHSLPAERAAHKEESGDFEELEHADVPELSGSEYAVLVQNIYVQYNPKKLRDIGALLQKYRHSERELYHEVCKKYGVHPAKFHAKHAQSLQEQLRSVKAEKTEG